MNNALWILKLFAKWSKLNRNVNINSYQRQYKLTEYNESVIKYTTKLPKFFANPSFSSKFKCHVEYSTWIKRNGINYRTMNKTYDEVDIGRRSPDDSFGGSRIHWENSPPSSSLIRSQWQISGSYRGYLIMSLHSGGGLLPTVNRIFTTF